MLSASGSAHLRQTPSPLQEVATSTYTNVALTTRRHIGAPPAAVAAVRALPAAVAAARAAPLPQHAAAGGNAARRGADSVLRPLEQPGNMSSSSSSKSRGVDGRNVGGSGNGTSSSGSNVDALRAIAGAVVPLPVMVVAPRPVPADSLAATLKRLRVKYQGTIVRAARTSLRHCPEWPELDNSTTSSDGRYIPIAQRWTAALESHIYAVAGEAGVPRGTAASIVAAARKGTVSCNPGVLLSQMLRVLGALEARSLGRRGALGLLRLLPTLLMHSADTLAWNYDLLESILPAPGCNLPSMLRRVPMLLTASPLTVWGNLHALASMLGLATDAVVALVAKQPRLLVNTPQAVWRRYRSLGRMLGLSRSDTAELVRRQPSLLTYFPQTLHSNCTAMAKCLGVPLPQIARLVAAQPTLAMLCQASLAAKIDGLASMLQMEHARPRLAALVLRQPALLTQSSEGLAAKLQGIQKVLLLSTTEEVATLVTSKPSLMTLSSSTLEAKAQLLARYCALEPAWAAHLASASANSRALWISFGTKRLQRLELMHAARPGGAVSLPQVLSATDAKFADVLGAATCSGASDIGTVLAVAPPRASGEERTGTAGPEGHGCATIGVDAEYGTGGSASSAVAEGPCEVSCAHVYGGNCANAAGDQPTGQQPQQEGPKTRRRGRRPRSQPEGES